MAVGAAAPDTSEDNAGSSKDPPPQPLPPFRQWLAALQAQAAAALAGPSWLSSCVQKERSSAQGGPSKAVPRLSADAVRASEADKANGGPGSSSHGERQAEVEHGPQAQNAVTLAAFGHGGKSNEGIYFFKPKLATDRGTNEERMLELLAEARLQGEPIAQHVPEFHGIEEREGQPNFKMTNMIHYFEQPRLLDCKIGVRCHTEGETKNTKLRKARHGRRQERPRGGLLRRGGLPSSAEAPLAPTQPRAGGLGRCEAGRGPRQSQELGG